MVHSGFFDKPMGVAYRTRFPVPDVPRFRSSSNVDFMKGGKGSWILIWGAVLVMPKTL